VGPSAVHDGVMQTQMLIGGEWRDGSGSERFDVENPATEEIIASVAAGTTDDATLACTAAADAQGAWAATAPRERGEILRRTWQLMVDHTDELARLITLEHGKPLADARGEVAYAAEFFRWNSEEAVRIHGLARTRTRRSEPDRRAPPAGRRRRDRDAVELPGRDDHAQARARARRRKRRGDQAADARPR
jgi:acyl-CoA reductase-like NAD-dependent aldehyde dehydrogenase